MAPESDGGTEAERDAGALDAGSDARAFTGLTYLEDVHPVFEAAGCSTFACHGSVHGGSGILLYMPTARVAYDDMLERVSVRGPERIVHAGAPDESVLVSHAEVDLVNFEVLTSDEAALVRRWVADGAVYSRSSASDAGIADAGTADAGSNLDAGVALSCSLEAARGWTPLPPGCLPRCERATWDAVVACRTETEPGTCQATVIDGDTSAPIEATGAADALPIDCALCFNWQTRSCLEESCLFELLALDRCNSVRPGDPCTAERTALGTCWDGHPEVQACQRRRDPLCAAP